MTVNRVAFILYKYPLGVSSMIINSIRLFAQRNYRVDIYINRQSYEEAPITFTEPGIRIIIFDDHGMSLLLRCYRFVIRRTGDYFLLLAKKLTVTTCLLLFYPDAYRFLKWLNRRLKKHEYTYIMPVEYMSLLCLAPVQQKGTILYYNMELLDWSKNNPLYGKNKRMLKELEYNMIRTIPQVVTPSPLRSDLFSEINTFDRESVYSLPVAPIGDPVIDKSRYFRDMFNIPDDHRIVLYSGNFQRWFQCLEIIKSVPHWPAKTVLVMHTWNRSALKTAYFRDMKRLAEGLPVYLSASYIPYNDLPEALSSADIGLAFYEALDDNFTEILFSSNKIGEYLKAGLGVICSDFSSLKQFVEDNGIGMAVPVHEIPKAVKKTVERIDIVRKQSLRCYHEQIRFENYFNTFHDKLGDRHGA